MTTQEAIDHTHAALKFLASRCDGARQLDGQGFNKIDKTFGRILAEKIALTPAEAKRGLKMVKKYARQLQAADISLPDMSDIVEEEKVGKLIDNGDRVTIQFHCFPPTEIRDYIKSLRYWKYNVQEKTWQVASEHLVDVADHPFFWSYEICHV